jgi:hypothetical protein
MDFGFAGDMIPPQGLKQRCERIVTRAERRGRIDFPASGGP